MKLSRKRYIMQNLRILHPSVLGIIRLPIIFARRTCRKWFHSFHPFFVDHIAYPVADKYAGHEAVFRRRHLLSNRMFPVTLCRGTLPYYRSLSSQSPFSRNISCSSPLTHRTWYMKHIALPSDSMTLTQPPSREIMPHDPVTPDHGAIFLPVLSVWIILSLQLFAIISIISHCVSPYMRSNARKLIYKDLILWNM